MAGSITLYPDNFLEDGTVTVTGTADTGYPESRLYDRALGFLWKDTVTAAQDYHLDYATAVECDFLAIEGHNFDGEDMEWQWSTDDAAWNDAVTAWTQSGNAQIVKVISSSLTKRYWKVTVTSMTNPQCGEIYMSLGYSFDILAEPGPAVKKISNVEWRRTVGGSARSTKFGNRTRQYTYDMFLSAADLTSFRAVIDLLDEGRYPFYIKDHEGSYWLCRLADEPIEKWDNHTYTHVTMTVIEVL